MSPPDLGSPTYEPTQRGNQRCVSLHVCNPSETRWFYLSAVREVTRLRMHPPATLVFSPSWECPGVTCSVWPRQAATGGEKLVRL